jgi:hypothetical protein
MSEAAERVEAWRRAKRQEGLRPVTYWVSPACKSALESLAYQRQQDVGACLMEVVQHFMVCKGARTPARLSKEDVRWITDHINAEVSRQLAHPETEAPLPRQCC